MKRGTLLLVILCLVSLASVGCEKRPEFPNVYVVVVGGLTPLASNLYADGENATPHFSEFIKNAVLYKNAVTSSSWALPSIASLLTGSRPMAHNMTDAAWSDGRLMRPNLSTHIRTLGEEMAKLGYTTFVFTNSPWITEYNHMTTGFNHSILLPGQNADTVADAVVEKRDLLQKNRRLVFVVLNDDGCAALSGAPWFDSKNAYLDFARKQDSVLGRVLETLAPRKSDIVVVTADHGARIDEAGAIRYGTGLTLLEMRVPLAIQYPEQRFAGRRYNELVAVRDVPATIFAALPIPKTALWGGLNLYQGLVERRLPERRIVTFFVSGETRTIGMFFQGRKYDYTFNKGPLSLYDYEKDPAQKRNLLESEPDNAEKMRREIEVFESRFERRNSRLLPCSIQEINESMARCMERKHTGDQEKP